MIIRNNKTTSTLYKGTKEIIKRYKGTLVVYEAFKKLIASGVPPITLQKCKEANLIDYKIYGNSVQKGANLFDGTYKNGYISSNKIAAFSETVGNHYLVVMPCEPNTTYILEKEYATERFTVGFTDEYPYTGCPIIRTLTNNSAKKITATSGENSQYLIAFVYNKTVDTLPLPNVEIYKEQSPDNPIEIQSVGDLVTDANDANYGKYKIPVKVNDNVTNIYLDEPLRKIGDYADYIDFANQKVVRNIYRYDLTGNETGWLDRNLNYDSYGIVFRNGHLLEKPANFQYKNAFCNYFNYGSIASAKGIFSFANSSTDWQFNISDGQLGISKDEEKSVRLQKWLEWLQTNYSNGNPVSMYYVLEEEIPETIELPNISTNKGTNIIEVDTSISPSNMQVKYYGKE